jgi:branched-chain amino acid transport system ATP-binding protein
VTAVLQATNVTVRFGGHTAVSSVDLSATEGTIVGLIGPNGAGKTTTFNALTGMIRPDTGRVILDGTDITGWAPYRRARAGMARTFQRLEVFTSLSVEDNVRVAIELRRRWQPFAFSGRWDRQSLSTEIDTILDRVGIADIRHETSNSLSTGKARLVEVARALATRPKLLLLDEPASGLDGAETERFAKLVKQLADEGMAVLMVEHDMDLVMSTCAHIFVLDFGSLIAQGTAQEVRVNPAVLAAYLGSAQEPAYEGVHE